MELSLLCDVKVFLFIYDSHNHSNSNQQSTINMPGPAGSHGSAAAYDNAKLIHYQSDPHDDLKCIVFKQNCNRIFYSNENVSNLKANWECFCSMRLSLARKCSTLMMKTRKRWLPQFIWSRNRATRVPKQSRSTEVLIPKIWVVFLT